MGPLLASTPSSAWSIATILSKLAYYDEQAGQLRGVYIVSAASSMGHWEFSVSSGSLWGPVVDGLHLSDAGSNLIRFVPDGSSAETPVLTLRAWDGSNGLASGQVDLLSPLLASQLTATSAYSSGTGLVTASVQPPNSAPTLGAAVYTATPILRSAARGPSVSVSTLAASLVARDPDSLPTALPGLYVDSIPSTSLGVFEFTVNNGATWSSVPRGLHLSNTPSTAVRFVSAQTGALGSASLGLRAWDGTNGLAEGDVVLATNRRPVLAGNFTAAGGGSALGRPGRTDARGVDLATVAAALHLTDPDGDVVGLAFTGVFAPSTVSVQVSTDAGATWQALVSTPSAARHFLISGAVRIRALAVAEYSLASSDAVPVLAAVAWDGSNGVAAGGSAPTSLGYATSMSPYSFNAARIVLPIDLSRPADLTAPRSRPYVPAGFGNPVTVTAAYLATLFGGGFTSFVLTELAGNGTWYVNGSALNAAVAGFPSATAAIPVSGATSFTLRYAPAAGDASDFGTVRVRGWDGDTGWSGLLGARATQLPLSALAPLSSYSINPSATTAAYALSPTSQTLTFIPPPGPPSLDALVAVQGQPYAGTLSAAGLGGFAPTAYLLSGPDAGSFEVAGAHLTSKAGVVFTSAKTAYVLTAAAVGVAPGAPGAPATFTIEVKTTEAALASVLAATSTQEAPAPVLQAVLTSVVEAATTPSAGYLAARRFIAQASAPIVTALAREALRDVLRARVDAEPVVIPSADLSSFRETQRAVDADAFATLLARNVDVSVRLPEPYVARASDVLAAARKLRATKQVDLSDEQLEAVYVEAAQDDVVEFRVGDAQTVVEYVGNVYVGENGEEYGVGSVLTVGNRNFRLVALGSVLLELLDMSGPALPRTTDRVRLEGAELTFETASGSKALKLLASESAGSLVAWRTGGDGAPSSSSSTAGPVTLVTFDASGSGTVTASHIEAHAFAASTLYASAFLNTSDARLKTDVRPLTPDEALPLLQTLRPVRYTWISRPGAAAEVGFLAQNVEGVLPEAVVQGADGYLRVGYDRITPLVVAGLRGVADRTRQLNAALDEAEALLSASRQDAEAARELVSTATARIGALRGAGGE
jgi:hypothetical protein